MELQRYSLVVIQLHADRGLSSLFSVFFFKNFSSGKTGKPNTDVNMDCSGNAGDIPSTVVDSCIVLKSSEWVTCATVLQLHALDPAEFMRPRVNSVRVGSSHCHGFLSCMMVTRSFAHSGWDVRSKLEDSG